MDKNGGPAFPQLADVPGGPYYVPGMSLRDYFAAHAPLVPEQWVMDHHLQSFDAATVCALWAAAYADAMLKAREGK